MNSTTLSQVIIILSFLVVSLGPAYASAAHCDRIKDSDRRHYCKALAKKMKSECESIKNSDLRNECRALVKKQD